MTTEGLIIISYSDYGALCWIAGLGWGFWLSTLIAALVIDHVKWRKWINRP